MAELTHLETRAGAIPFPAYIPVTTFGGKYPLDDLIRPYLPRLAPAIMVSHHYAQRMEERPRVPMLIDSGGFASLFERARIVRAGGVGVLDVTTDDGVERLEPGHVLEFQEATADVAFTLDFPIPPGMGAPEGQERLELTIANAHWMLANRRRRDLPLYACAQGWDKDSFLECVSSYVSAGFDGIAIGGLVPRARDQKTVFDIVDAVRGVVPDLPLHVFGLGKPDMVQRLFSRGIQSIDSSSYVKMAADGRSWADPELYLPDASTTERLQLAIWNLATATRTTLPLPAGPMNYHSSVLPQLRPQRVKDTSVHYAQHLTLV